MRSLPNLVIDRRGIRLVAKRAAQRLRYRQLMGLSRNVPDHIHLERCRELIAALAAERGWEISDTALQQYTAVLAPLLADLDDVHWHEVVGNYVLDHAHVRALRDHNHPEHNGEWKSWTTQALGVLRHAGLDWSTDAALADEDLVQEAIAELARALPSYGYRSRFTSWAYRVLVQSAQRQIRFATTQRRGGRPDSLSQLPAEAEPGDPAPPHHHTVDARLLERLIASVLDEHPDKRLSRIFVLWAIHDQSTAEIGRLFNIHESRARALLKLARDYLRAHPQIRDWAGLDDTDDGA
jgi:RNA polymerase sigma factor (sigma-70 family)